MDTILNNLRSLHMQDSVKRMDSAKEAEVPGCEAKEEKLNGVYRCRACGYIFDESLEGKPFSTLTECPLCHVSPGGFMKLR